MQGKGSRSETRGPALRLLDLFRDPAGLAGTLRWRIRGYPATAQIWTEDEWARLAPQDRPADAQGPVKGVYVRLAMD